MTITIDDWVIAAFGAFVLIPGLIVAILAWFASWGILLIKAVSIGIDAGPSRGKVVAAITYLWFTTSLIAFGILRTKT